MLGKMLIHGLVSAAFVGGIAAVYAQVKDNGTLFPQVAQTEATGRTNLAVAVTARTGDHHDRQRDHDDD